MAAGRARRRAPRSSTTSPPGRLDPGPARCRRGRRCGLRRDAHARRAPHDAARSRRYDDVVAEVADVPRRTARRGACRGHRGAWRWPRIPASASARPSRTTSRCWPRCPSSARVPSVPLVVGTSRKSFLSRRLVRRRLARCPRRRHARDRRMVRRPRRARRTGPRRARSASRAIRLLDVMEGCAA